MNGAVQQQFVLLLVGYKYNASILPLFCSSVPGMHGAVVLALVKFDARIPFCSNKPKMIKFSSQYMHVLVHGAVLTDDICYCLIYLIITLLCTDHR
jgi:hypothetical protein